MPRERGTITRSIATLLPMPQICVMVSANHGIALMSLADETAGLIEVAAAIKREPDWLRRNWLKLHRDTGFPRKHPSGWTWPRAAVAAWLRGGGASAPQLGSANDNQGIDADAAWRAALDARYGGRP